MLRLTSDDPVTVMIGANVLDLMGKPQGHLEAVSFLEEKLGGLYVAEYRPATPTLTPALWVVTNNGQLAIFSQGVDYSRAVALVEGWIDEDEIRQAFGFNWRLHEGYMFRDRDNLASLFSTAKSAFLFGHSGGGAYVTLIDSFQGPGEDETERFVCTFGAPRVCVNGKWDRPHTSYARFMNVGDTVPALPPTGNNWEFFAVLFAGLLNIAPVPWRHSPGGIALYDGGYTVIVPRPIGRNVGTAADLASWMAGQESDTTSYHPMRVYKDRIYAMATRLLSTADLILPGAAAEFPSPPSPDVMADLPPGIRAIIRETFGGPSAVLPTLHLGARFTVEHSVSSGYLLRFEGRLVAKTNSRAAALRLAQRGNGFLRRLLKAQSINPTTLTLGFTDFFSTSIVDPAQVFPTPNIVSWF